MPIFYHTTNAVLMIGSQKRLGTYTYSYSLPALHIIT